MWPKTTVLPVWPRDAKKLNTPAVEFGVCLLPSFSGSASVFLSAQGPRVGCLTSDSITSITFTSRGGFYCDWDSGALGFP